MESKLKKMSINSVGEVNAVIIETAIILSGSNGIF